MMSLRARRQARASQTGPIPILRPNAEPIIVSLITDDVEPVMTHRDLGELRGRFLCPQPGTAPCCKIKPATETALVPVLELGKRRVAVLIVPIVEAEDSLYSLLMAAFDDPQGPAKAYKLSRHGVKYRLTPVYASLLPEVEAFRQCKVEEVVNALNDGDLDLSSLLPAPTVQELEADPVIAMSAQGCDEGLFADAETGDAAGLFAAE